MSIKDTIKADLTTAMKARDDITVSTLRMALTAIGKAEVAGDEQVELTDEQVMAVLQSESKRRADAAALYTQGGRPALRIELDDNWTVLPAIQGQHQKAKGTFGFDPVRAGDLKVHEFAPDLNIDKSYLATLTIKGKLAKRARLTGNVGVYQLRGCPSYASLTKPNRWFCSEDDARAADDVSGIRAAADVDRSVR